MKTTNEEGRGGHWILREFKGKDVKDPRLANREMQNAKCKMQIENTGEDTGTIDALSRAV